MMICITLVFIPASTVLGDGVNSMIFKALDKADAIKRFKTADSNGDCKISKLELGKYAVDHLLDPIQFLLGSSFNGKSGIQVGPSVVIRYIYIYIYDWISCRESEK